MGGTLGTIAEIAAPIAGAAFLGPEIGLLSGLGSAASAGLGAGLAETGTGLFEGKGLGRSLKQGALAGAGTFGGEELFGAGGAFSGGGGDAAGASGSGGGNLFSDAAKSVGLGSPVGGAPGASAASAAAPAGGGFASFGGDVTAPLDESLSGFNKSIGNLTADLGGAGGGSAAPAAGFTDSLKNNFVKGLESPSTLLSAGNLALGAAKQGELLKGERQLQGEAGQLAGQGKELAGYLQSGTLPPGVQGGITQATQAAKAQIRSQYASRGMSGSSAEQADLARADQSAQTQGAEIAIQLLQQGVNESGLASRLYEQILQNSMEKDKELGASFTNFAQALGGASAAPRS